MIHTKIMFTYIWYTLRIIMISCGMLGLRPKDCSLVGVCYCCAFDIWQQMATPIIEGPGVSDVACV